MSASPRTYDKVRFHRGTRGFAAFLTGLNGFVVLGATLFVVPTLPLEPLVATWAVILGMTLAIAHFAAVVGLIPVAVGTSEGGETRAPMGIAVIGGLLASTFLTLYVIPVVYLLMDRLTGRKAGR